MTDPLLHSDRVKIILVSIHGGNTGRVSIGRMKEAK